MSTPESPHSPPTAGDRGPRPPLVPAFSATAPLTAIAALSDPNENRLPRQLRLQQRRAQSIAAANQNSQRTPVRLQSLETYLPPFQVVYGANSVAGSEDSARVMSEKVQMLASSIYKELESMINKHGEDSVKELMPLVVNVLESLDLAYLDKDESAVDLEMLKEENEQLLNQYERERQTRKAQDQEILTEQNRDLENKIENMEGNVRMLELKVRNANDHVNRCEEREVELKQEFEKLHERYNELMRTHIEHVERSKYLMGADKFDMMQSLTPGHNRSGMAASVDVNARGITDLISAAHMSQSTHASVNLANHISDERDFHEEFGQDAEELLSSGRKAGNTTSEELEQHLEEADDDEKDETEDDGLAAQLTVNDAFIGMGREVDNLIRENTELLETKNALNIVKNDLIAKVDDLTSENEVLRDELRALDVFKAKQTEKIRELEQEIKTIKEKAQEELDEQEGIPMAQRKRFTRVEMARVLMERNQYKERLMELQEAVKFTEMQRVKKMNTQQTPSKGRVWDFFSGLFGDTPAPSQPVKRSGRSSSQVRKQRLTRTFDIDQDSVQEKRKAERRQQYKAVSQHMKKDDDNRTRAYGWSLPTTADDSVTQSVPVPVCCRPLLDQQPSLKIWCASGVTLHGGKNVDGEFIVSDSAFYSDPVKCIPSEDVLRKRLLEDWPLWESSSVVWVGSSNERRSYITILDANNPNCILECFSVCTSHLLCISSIPGVRAEDFACESPESAFVREGGYLTGLPPDINATETFGQVQYIELRTSEVDEVPTFCSMDEKASPKRTRDFSVSDTPADQNVDEPTAVVKKTTVKRVGFEITGLNDPPTSARSRVTLLEKSALNRPTPQAEQHGENKDEGDRDLTAYANLPPHIRDAMSNYEGQAEMGTALPTMWMGLENDLHHNGLVFAALANGTIAVFHRDTSGKWATDGYHLIRLGQASSSVCNLTVVGTKIWAAYRNCVVIIDPKDLSIEAAFVVHPRKDSQVKHMVWAGDGVWMSIRLDSTIRLFHSQTLRHLQDVDIEPYLTNMLGNTKMDFLHLRITSLVALRRQLWIGTGTGVVISVPLTNEASEKVEVTQPQAKGEVKSPGGLVRVYAGDEQNEQASFLPYCNISQAQFSFHGHKDSVRFFICVPSDGITSMTATLESRKLLMISGGDGYIDFRLGEDDEVTDELRIRDMSHLIVWEMDSSNPYKTVSS